MELRPLAEHIPSKETIVSISRSTRRGMTKFEAVILCIIFSAVIYLSPWTDLASESEPTQEAKHDKLRRIFWSFNLLLLCFAFFALPKKKISTPGMGVMYRLVQASAIVYGLNMLVWALMDASMLKEYINVLDPGLKDIVYEERDFSIDCRLYTPENPDSKFANLASTIDFFVLGHLVGWMVKSMIYRNNILAWTMSILFEFQELSLKHWLPNFNECWWDHILLDLLGMNLLGILLGNWIMNKLRMPKFHWFFDPTDESEKMGYFQRFIYSFTSVKDYVSSHKWHFLARPRCFLAVTWVILLSSATDLSWFFLKSALNLPPKQVFMGIRVWVVGLFSLIVIQDFHKWVKRSGKQRLITFNVALGHGLLFLEIVTFWKNKPDNFFDNPTPFKVRVFWGGVVALFFFGLYTAQCYSKKKFLKNVE